jgi:hypothetical protein
VLSDTRLGYDNLQANNPGTQHSEHQAESDAEGSRTCVDVRIRSGSYENANHRDETEHDRADDTPTTWRTNHERSGGAFAWYRSAGVGHDQSICPRVVEQLDQLWNLSNPTLVSSAQRRVQR